MIRLAQKKDLEIIIQIEQICFPPAEAASALEFQKRFKAFPECFLVAEVNQKIIGFIDGAITNQPLLPDELYHDTTLHQPNGCYQTVFSLAVLPEYQKQGVGEQLMKTFIDYSKNRGKHGVVLTCKDHLIHYYAKFGYKHMGISKSCHGQAKWNDMLLLF